MPFRNIEGSGIESITQLGKEYREDSRNTSVSLGHDGGDTHIHANSDKSVTVTTRLKGGYEEHFQYTDVSTASYEFDPTEDAATAFRFVFGDDNLGDSK